MHVLSLPPAFVLSQDQTLKLRIQSRHNHVVVLLELNGRSYTLKTPRSLNPAAPRALVLPFQKRDRRSLFLEPSKARKLHPIRATSAAHVSLSHLQLSKNRQNQKPCPPRKYQTKRPDPSQNLHHQEPKHSARDLQSTPAKSRNFRASSSVASSAAALVGERFIDPTQSFRQQPYFKKMTFLVDH